jgi:starch synthase
LADVAGSLPQALSAYVDSIQVITPLYGLIDRQGYQIEPTEINGTVALGKVQYAYTIFQSVQSPTSSVQTWFVFNEEFFGRDGIYTDETGEGFEDNNLRYFFFQLVILDLAKRKLISFDLIHCNDHHTGLLPVLLHSQGVAKKSVFTIHNFLYHGHFSKDELKLLPTSMRKLVTKTQWDNYSALLEGVSHADIINTVSQGYAEELLAGENVDPHSLKRIQGAKSELRGIVNGIDTEYWNPMLDQYLTAHYSEHHLAGKRANKIELLERVGLKGDANAPLIGSISRLVENKGFPLIVELLVEFIEQGVKFVFLGSGDPMISKQLRKFSQTHPDQIAFDDGFNEPLAHLIEAGSDMFLMPSRFEPCGLNQLYSLRYGTIPIVNKTGGLSDTVEPWSSGSGTGFVFEPYETAALRDAIESSLEVYADKKEWLRLVKRAMKKDFSWDISAKQYYQLYKS